MMFIEYLWVLIPIFAVAGVGVWAALEMYEP
jgi:hypothetical protein